MNEQVFALDIGTQTVTGILLEKKDEMYHVVDFCVRQHTERAMLDGQIHNVVQVSDVITDVKEQLEKNAGPLKKVCVAAAGRALKTVQMKETINIIEQPITNSDEVKYLELSAVRNAQLLLTKEDNENVFANYHCVGYSVLHYTLDGQQIGSIIDQVGDEAAVEVIATFLPKVVVESLLAALDRSNLTMDALTLEPIAAIQVLVPDSMRRLNVVLIDIGAGTSDIAITNNGTVVAYGMVPVAGDEITEAISDAYLLDFKIAEKTKRDIVNQGEAIVHDILGFETNVTYDELVPKIINNVDNLAKLLAEEIITLNAVAPRAVMLIGGGSFTPKIAEKIAGFLQLPENRVAIRGLDAIQQLEKNDDLPTGPDFVTPIGIAIAASQNPVHYISVSVNEKMIRMFEMKQLSVGDCLVQAGIETNKFYGRPGLASIIKVNDKNITIRGEYGEAPTIYINEEIKTIDNYIQSGDKITIKKGNDGTDPYVTIEQFIGEVPEIPFYFNDKEYLLQPSYTVNNKKVNKEYIIQDNDDINVCLPNTIKDFIQLEEIDLLGENSQFFVIVNNKKINMKQGRVQILLNGEQTDLNQIIKKNDRVTIIEPEKITMESLLLKLEKTYWHTVEVTFNNKAVKMKNQRIIVKRNDTLLDENSILNHRDKVEFIEQKIQPFIFQDVFRFVDFDVSEIQGQYTLRLNGGDATFHNKLKNGDNLELH